MVDIDPEMVRIAKELPFLKRLNEKSMSSPKLTAFNDDAFSFINQPGILYDRVIIDMPDPHNEAIKQTLFSRILYHDKTPHGAKWGTSHSKFIAVFYAPSFLVY